MLKLFVFIFITLLFSGHSLAEACSSSNTNNCYTLQLHYTFSEGINQTTADISGNGRHGSLINNPSWVANGPNYYLDFNRANKTSVKSPPFQPPADGVVAFWLKVPPTAPVRRRIFGFDDGWEIRWEPDNVMYLDINKTGTNESIRTSSAITATDTWMHIAVVTSATNNTWSVYIDGVLDNSGSESLTPRPNPQALSIGTRTNINSDYLDGSVDDFRIYSGVLTATEIAELANNSPACCLDYPYETDFEGDNTEWTPDNDWAISSSGHGAWQARSGSKFLDNNPLEEDQEFHRNHYIALNKPVYIPTYANTPTLSFYYKSGLFSGQVYSMISTNGTTWRTLETYTDRDNHSDYTKREINLDSYKGQTVLIRFRQYYNAGSGPRLFVVDDFRLGDFQSDNYSYPYNNGFETEQLREHFNYQGDWNSSQAHDTLWYPSEGNYFLDNNYNNEEQVNGTDHSATMNGYITLPSSNANPVISFDYLSSIFDGRVYLQLQEEGSTQWRSLRTFNEQFNHTPYTTHEYNLSSFLGKTVRFRFRQYWSANPTPRTFTIDNIFVGELSKALPFPYTNSFETANEKSDWQPEGDWNISTSHDTKWFPSEGSSFLDNNSKNDNQANHREHYATMSGFIPLPADSSNVVVSYDYLANIFDGQVYLYIQKMGQNNWSHIKTYNNRLNRASYGKEELSLAAFGGEKVRFRFRQYYYSQEGARVFTVDNFEVKQTSLKQFSYPYFTDFETLESTPVINGQDHWHHTGDWGISLAHDGLYNPNDGAYFLDNNVEFKDQANHREHFSTMSGFVQLPAAPANPIVSFDYLLSIFGGFSYLQIQEEGSNQWSYLHVFREEFNHSPYTKYEYNLSRYLGKKVRFRFRQYWYANPGKRVFTIDNFYIGELSEMLPFPYENGFETAEEQAQWHPDGDWNISSAHDTKWYPSSGTHFLDNNSNNENQANQRDHYAAMSGYIPLPEDSSNVVVTFDYLLNAFDGQFYIYIQKMGQSNWSYLKVYNAQLNRDEYTKEEISLAAFGGEKVRFRFRQYHYSTEGARVFAIDNFKVENVVLKAFDYPYFNDFETAISTPTQNGQDHWTNTGDWKISQAHNTVYAPQGGQYFLDNNGDNEDQANHREHYATMNGFITLPSAPENPMLSFDYTATTFRGAVQVQVQEFGSNTWRSLNSFNETNDHKPYTKFEYFLSAYAGKKVRFRFRQYWFSDVGKRVFSIDNVFVGELKQELPYPYVNTFETEEEQAQWQPEGDWAVNTAHDENWYPKSGNYFLDGNADKENQRNHRNHYATLSGYIQLPEDTSNVIASFDYLLNTFNGQSYVYIQRLGESNWRYIKAYRSTDNHDGYVREEIPLTAYAGAKVRFRFRQYYYSDDGARVFGIDNFKVGVSDLPDFEYPYFNDFETPTSTATVNGQDHWNTKGDWGISTEHDNHYTPKNGQFFLDNNVNTEDQSNHRDHYSSILGYVPIALEANNPQLSFWYKSNIYRGFVYVQIQEKGATTWRSIFRFNEQFSHSEYTKFYYDLSAFKGKSIRVRFRQDWYSDSGPRVFTVDDFRIGDDDRVNLSYPYTNTFETEGEREDFIHNGDWGTSTAHNSDYVPYKGDWFLDNNVNFVDQQNHRDHYSTLNSYVPIPTNAVVPTLSFWYKVNSFSHATYVQIRRKGETQWRNLYSFTEDKNHDEYVKFEAYLDAYKGDEVLIRFRQYWHSEVGPRLLVIDNLRIGDLIQEPYNFPYYNNFDTQASTASKNGRDHWNTEADWGVSDQNSVTGVAKSGDWFLDNNPADENQSNHRDHYATMRGFVNIPNTAVNPKISFDYKGNISYGFVYLHVQRAGSSTWRNIKRFSSHDNTTTYEHFTLSLNKFKGESVRFRFRQYYYSNAGDREFHVDNFAIDQELLGLWYFEENWEDATDNGFDLTPINTPVFDKTTRAKDGAIGTNTSTCFYTGFKNNQYAIASGTQSQSDFNEITISAWVNPSSYNANLSTIFSKSEHFSIYLNSSGNIQWQYLSTQLTSGSVVALNEWTHIALTFKDGEQHIYINGVSVATATVAGILTELDEDIYIAGELNSSNTVYADRYFNGTIDELRVYRTAQSSAAIAADMNVLRTCEINTKPDHYRITHDGSGLTCAAETVTLTACNNAECTEYNEAPQTVTLLINSSDQDTISSIVTFEKNTQVSFNHPTPTSVEFSIVNGENSPSIHNFQCKGGTEDSPCSMIFKSAELKFLNANNVESDNIDHQISGVNFNHSVQIQAVKNNEGVCENVFVNKNVAIGFLQENQPPTDISTGNDFTINNIPIPRKSFKDITLSFNANGIATIPNPIYLDAGEIKLQAKYSQDGVNLSGSSNAFWVRPFALKLNAVFNTPHIAGQDFTLHTTPINAQNGVTQNYKQNDIELSVKRLTPEAIAPSTSDGNIGGIDGVFSYNNAVVELFTPTRVILDAFAFNAEDGVYKSTSNKLNYSEVGSISIDVKDMEYGGIYGFNVPSHSAIAVGSFIPDHFDVELDSHVNPAFGNTCELGENPFTYIGQPFGYKDANTAISKAPKFIVTAKNYKNEVTQNYTEAVKLTQASIKRLFPNVDDENLGKDNTNKLTITPTIESAIELIPIRTSKDSSGAITTGGTMEYHFNDADRFVYNRNENALISPFTAEYTITIDSIKAESVSDNITHVPSNGSGATLPIQLTFNAQIEDLDNPINNTPNNSIELRYGRLQLADNFGPETSDLPITLSTEYWRDDKFIINPDDQCTFVDPMLLKITAENSGLTSVKPKPKEALVKGATQFILTAPGAGKQGNALVEYDASLSDWLQYDWDNNSIPSNPKANAVFGIFRGNDRIIYWREVF